MWQDRESQRYMFAFTGAFLLFVLLRIAVNIFETPPDRLSYIYVLPQIVSTLIVSCWMLTIQSRIIHSNTKRLILWIGVLFLTYFLMQMIKYCLFNCEPDVTRYMWYGYYVPMTLIPLLVFYIVRDLSLQQGKRSYRLEKLLALIAVIICLGFLTNDLHQLAFRIPNWYENGDKGRTFGPFYYMDIAFYAVLLFVGMRNMVRMFKSRKSKKNLAFTLIPLVIGVLFLVVYTLREEWIMVNGHKILEMPEIFAFMIIGFLEACIQIGMIPSNMGYKKLFSMSYISARVSDLDGNIVFETRGAEENFEETDNHHIVPKNVTGGTFFYGVDLSNLNALNRALDDEIDRLEARNELLRYENEIVEERKRPEAAIRIYDSISDIVRPQVMEIRELLSEGLDDEKDFRSNLVKSAVLNAYIKRRSNMELEAGKNGMLPFRELVTAAAESLEYFKLSGTETFLSYSGEGSCRAEDISRAYYAFERVLETVLGKADYLTLRLTLEDTVCMRFLLSGEADLNEVGGLELDGCSVEYKAEEKDAKLLIRLSKGGDDR